MRQTRSATLIGQTAARISLSNLEYDCVKFQSANFNVSSTSFVQHAFGIFARKTTSDLVIGDLAYRF